MAVYPELERVYYKMTSPRRIVICCEGKTEELYFNVLNYGRNINGAVVKPAISLDGEQHTKLIDTCVEIRAQEAADAEFNIDDVEVWAVCDRDGMMIPYTHLNRYADEKGVRLAYSDPQFESYLLQHFEQNSLTGSSTILQSRLSELLSLKGYSQYSKTDLSWLEDIIDEKPKTIEMAIVNSNIRNRSSRPPFLTVQHLASRLLEFELK